jgi:hypothetical protein
MVWMSAAVQPVPIADVRHSSWSKTAGLKFAINPFVQTIYKNLQGKVFLYQVTRTQRGTECSAAVLTVTSGTTGRQGYKQYISLYTRTEFLVFSLHPCGWMQEVSLNCR